MAGDHSLVITTTLFTASVTTPSGYVAVGVAGLVCLAVVAVTYVCVRVFETDKKDKKTD